MDLGVVEKKVLGALMILAGGATEVVATSRHIADTMGYKSPGGAITFALRVLERDNYLARIPNVRSGYRLLI